MTADRSAYHKARREQERGGPARVPKPCGTVAAARRHQRAGEPLCAACAEAWRAKNAAAYRARKPPKEIGQ